MDFNLSINSITKTFNNNKIIANDNISTQFIPGKITALTGHNGAGKTTLLNQIMGIVRPNKGSITFAGHSFTQEPENDDFEDATITCTISRCITTAIN